MTPKKIVYYTDPLNDDFAGTKIKHRPLPENYKYVHYDPFSYLFGRFLYWIIAIPVLWVVGKIMGGVTVKGKKNLRMARRQGCFFYGNHTQIVDAWLIQCFSSPWRRSYIVADQDATSIPGLRYLVNLLGCLPVPETPEEGKKFTAAVRHHIKRRHGIVIYPEAHIWPYATHIRPFGDHAFTYPAELGAPSFAFCVTYRERLIFKNRPPRMTVHISRPIYPDMKKSLPDRRKEIRDRVYEYMIEKSCEDENVEYIAYIQKDGAEKE